MVVAGGTASFDAPDGSDIYETELTAPMLLRPVAGDFTLEAALTARPDQFYQGAGLVLWVGPRTYVRLERGYGDIGSVVFEYKNGGDHTRARAPFKENPNNVATDADQVVLRLERQGDVVRGAWRPADETGFQELGEIGVTLPRTVKAGVAVLNRAQDGAGAEPFSVSLERVTVTC